MPRRLVAALAVVVLLTISPMSLLPTVAQDGAQAAAVAPAAEPTIVDELSAGFTPGGPGWHEGAGGYADHHYWTAAVSGPTTRMGIWRATLPTRGFYRVDAMIPPRHATTRGARYRIACLDGWHGPNINQSRARGKWVSLGVCELGTSAVVRLSARTGDAGSGRMVGYDALRFVLLPQPLPVIREVRVEPAETRAVVTFSLALKGPARTEYREAGASDWLLGARETSYDYAEHRQVIEGLRPETRYELRVIATYADRTTISDIVPFRTDLRTVDCAAGEDLQAAIDKARSGDTLRIRGACGGDRLTFGRDLTLKGVTADATIVRRFDVGDVSLEFIDLRVQAYDEVTNRGRLILDRVDFTVLHLWNAAGATLTVRRAPRLYVGHEMENRGTVTVTDSQFIRPNGGTSSYCTINHPGASMTFTDSRVGGWFLCNRGTATLQGVTLADDTPYARCSAPISNSGVLTITGSAFTGNKAFYDDGCSASVLKNSGTVSITDSAVLRNTGGQGAILNTGSITLTNVTFRDNEPADCVGCQ